MKPQLRKCSCHNLQGKNYCRIEYKVGVMKLDIEIVVFKSGVRTR